VVVPTLFQDWQAAVHFVSLTHMRMEANIATRRMAQKNPSIIKRGGAPVS
jgi:hypothetical protein